MDFEEPQMRILVSDATGRAGEGSHSPEPELHSTKEESQRNAGIQSGSGEGGDIFRDCECLLLHQLIAIHSARGRGGDERDRGGRRGIGGEKMWSLRRCPRSAGEHLPEVVQQRLRREQHASDATASREREGRKRLV